MLERYLRETKGFKFSMKPEHTVGLISIDEQMFCLSLHISVPDLLFFYQGTSLSVPGDITVSIFSL